MADSIIGARSNSFPAKLEYSGFKVFYGRWCWSFGFKGRVLRKRGSGKFSIKVKTSFLANLFHFSRVGFRMYKVVF